MFDRIFFEGGTQPLHLIKHAYQQQLNTSLLYFHVVERTPGRYMYSRQGSQPPARPRDRPRAGLEVLYASEEQGFRRYQSGQPTVFSGAYIITVLQYVYVWPVL